MKANFSKHLSLQFNISKIIVYEHTGTAREHKIFRDQMTLVISLINKEIHKKMSTADEPVMSRCGNSKPGSVVCLCIVKNTNK